MVRALIFFHKIEWVCMVLRILNLKGHPNCMICLKATKILTMFCVHDYWRRYCPKSWYLHKGATAPKVLPENFSFCFQSSNADKKKPLREKHTLSTNADSWTDKIVEKLHIKKIVLIFFRGCMIFLLFFLLLIDFFREKGCVIILQKNERVHDLPEQK